MLIDEKRIWRRREAMTTHIALCTYRAKTGAEKQFEGLLARHRPTLRAAGLVTAKRPTTFRGTEDGGGTFYVEILEWKDAEAPNEAHELPTVMAVWEPMGMCVEDRDGRPGMEFPHVERLRLDA
jgi:hypothetical protein